MSILRFALIGCGDIARKHAVSLGRIPEVELTAVCDLNPKRASMIGSEYDVPYYMDYREMLKTEKIDVVSVLTPPADHARQVVDLVHFLENIIVEKPIAPSLEDADRMIQSCEKAGARLFVVKQNRYNYPIQALRRALVAGRFGKLVLGTACVRWSRDQAYYEEASWRGIRSLGGGTLINHASHHIDMLQWMLGEVESVFAMTAPRLVRIEAEDTGIVTMRFRNGALGLLEATTAVRPVSLEGSFSILGEKGSVVIGGYAMDRLNTWNFSEPQPEDKQIFEKWGENPKEFAWNHTECIRDILQDIRGNKKTMLDGLTARKSLELTIRICESARISLEVTLKI